MGLISTTVVARMQVKNTAMAEYNRNFTLYKLSMQNISRDNPGISDQELGNKVSECGISRQPKSWAYYVLQATNKLAGRCEPQNFEAFDTDTTEATTSFDANGESVTLIKNPSSELEELKNKVDSILLRANNGGIFGWNLWLQQFKNLSRPSAGPTAINYIIHVLTFPWKLLAALIPPAAAFGGYVAFVMSSIALMILTALILDISGHLGCFIFSKDCVTAFIIISIGLNIPNLVAAKLAAVEEETADLSLQCLLAGNVLTASLGFGISWLLGSVYWEARGDRFVVPVGSLGFCITEFVAIGLLAIIILLGRRCCAGGELGGNQVCKIITSIIFFLLWIYFLIIIPLEAYGV